MESQYPKNKMDYLIEGPTNGFDIGYRDPQNRKDFFENMPLHVRNETKLWNKVIKEVGEDRYASPFDQFPLQHFIQSPIGLVPKA